MMYGHRYINPVIMRVLYAAWMLFSLTFYATRITHVNMATCHYQVALLAKAEERKKEKKEGKATRIWHQLNKREKSKDLRKISYYIVYSNTCDCLKLLIMWDGKSPNKCVLSHFSDVALFVFESRHPERKHQLTSKAPPKATRLSKTFT